MQTNYGFNQNSTCKNKQPSFKNQNISFGLKFEDFKEEEMQLTLERDRAQLKASLEELNKPIYKKLGTLLKNILVQFK